MNPERILAVADAIENNTIQHLDFNLRFMTEPQANGCGSLACVAGYTLAIKNGEFKAIRENGSSAAFDAAAVEAGDWLGLSKTEREMLFFPDSHGGPYDTGWFDCMYDLEDVPKEQAVRTLRHLAATGEVDWTV